LQIISKSEVTISLTTIPRFMRDFMVSFVRILGVWKDLAGNRANELENVSRSGIVSKFSDFKVVAVMVTKVCSA